MEKLAEQMLCTWIQSLIVMSQHQLAALLVDADLELEEVSERGDAYQTVILALVIKVLLPPSAYATVLDDPEVERQLRTSLVSVAQGHWDTDKIKFCYKLAEIDSDWRNVVKELIANAKNPNQAVITEKLFARDQKSPHTYNEMKFGSKSEIRIAQALEGKIVLFFPLPLGVRAETGEYYKDHREPDFLVCFEGLWGILEVAYHPDRYEKDKEKDSWWKKSGILCVEHYTAERCFNDPEGVVADFLGILKQHKR